MRHCKSKSFDHGMVHHFPLVLLSMSACVMINDRLFDDLIPLLFIYYGVKLALWAVK